MTTLQLLFAFYGGFVFYSIFLLVLCGFIDVLGNRPTQYKEKFNVFISIEFSTAILILVFCGLTFERYILGYYQDLTDFDTGYPGYILTIIILYVTRKMNKMFKSIILVFLFVLIFYYLVSEPHILTPKMVNINLPNLIFLTLNLLQLLLLKDLIDIAKKKSYYRNDGDDTREMIKEKEGGISMKLFTPRKILIYSILYLFLYELILIRTPEFIPNVSASLGRITFAIAAGYIPSYFIYYLVTEYPRKKETPIARKQIRELINYIVQDFSNIHTELEITKNDHLQEAIIDPSRDAFNPIQLSYSKTNGKLLLPDISMDFFFETSNLIYPHKETFTAEIITTPKEVGSAIDIVKIPWLIYIKKMVASTRVHIEHILTYTNYLSVEELNKLQDIRSSEFASYIMNFENSFQNMRNTHVKSWKDDYFPNYLWEYYNLIRVLNEQERLKK
ncbi:hypothetical protein [Guptibacillus hwajinpoensis]|uniref:hypothetical protein n=1 Tax=Guptibacillus hwajinpoensis TaxID=208199 RepID=UPI003736B2E2